MSLALLLLLLDQGSKWWAHSFLRLSGPYDFGVLRLVYSQNLGGWGGLGSGWGGPMRSLLLTVLPLAVMAWVIHRLWTQPHLHPMASGGLALVLGGGLGNLLDRMLRGYVVDFLYLGYGPIGTNIFNVADMVLLLGLFLMIRAPEPAEEKGKSS